MNWGISHLLALLIGFCLDLLLRDSYWVPHPIRTVGVLITIPERLSRWLFPEPPGGELAGGAVLVALTITTPTGLTALLLWRCDLLSPWLAFAAEAPLYYQLLAARSLRGKSDKVYEAFKAGDLPGTWHAISVTVGQDTEWLDKAGAAKAAMETVAENASDRVIVLLIFLALGGTPLGMLHKAVSTADSMAGYKDDRYLYFGRAAARLDGALNFFPARIAGVFVYLGGAATGYDGKGVQRIFWRGRKGHKSPNSAHTEAAYAGALQLQLAGPSYYFGQLVNKPTIGDDQRPVETLDILRADRVLYATVFFTLLLFCGVPLLILPFP